MNGFTRWWKTRECCDDCFARLPGGRGNVDVGVLTALNFNLDAPWKLTVVDHKSYMLEDNVSPFSDVDGWQKPMAMRDWAHHDNLGYGRDFGGALLKSLHKRRELAPIDEPLSTQLRHVMYGLNVERKARGSVKLSGSLTPASCGMDNM